MLSSGCAVQSAGAYRYCLRNASFLTVKIVSCAAGDIAGARARLPRFLAAEHAILEALSKRDAANWLGAISNIPKNLRSMYPHAYQVCLSVSKPSLT